MAEADIFKTVLFYVFLILFVPVAAFFVSRNIVFELVFSMDTSSSTLYAAAITVIVIHGVLGLFVMRAFEDEKGAKRD